MRIVSRATARPYLFAALSFLVLVLAVDVLGLVEIGDPKGSGMVLLSPSTVGAWRALDADARQLLDKEHQSIVDEIKLRIEQEHQLFALKFALVGGDPRRLPADRIPQRLDTAQ